MSNIIKSYDQILRRKARDYGIRAFHNYMSGSNNSKWYDIPIDEAVSIISLIYNVNEKRCKKKLYKLCNLYFERELKRARR